MSNQIYIGIGTNIENRKKNLQTALEEIAQFSTILKKSSIYETEPVGYTAQPKFLNMVISAKTTLTPSELIISLQEIEHKMGRNREQEIKNGPRIIDLDILFYNDQVINYQNLIIPHPRLHQRSFVLDPLSEIAADFVHPQLNQKIKTLVTNLSHQPL